MGSTGGVQDEITVLVTGFGPFKEQFPQNPAWEIASRLPDYLPPLRAKSTPHMGIAGDSGAAAAATTTILPAVRILVHPEPVRVNYQVVRKLVPRLWDASEHHPHQDHEHVPGPLWQPGQGQQNGGGGEDGDNHDAPQVPAPSLPPPPVTQGRRIDVAIHIGMAGPRLHYSVERLGHRDGYNMRDVDHELLGDEERRAREGKNWVWHGVPPVLETDFDLDDVLRRWKAYSPDNSDLRISHDAGHYLCDFIYFSSLAHLHKAGEYRRVVFLHVPSAASSGAVATGRELALQLIRSICESEQARGRKWVDDGEA